MNTGLRQRDSARQQRRSSGRPAAARHEPRPLAERPKKGEERPPSLPSIIGDAVHGILFLGLTLAALVHFGQVFDVVAAVVAALAAMSLKEAWSGLRRYLGR
jgi:hypothetical protein